MSEDTAQKPQAWEQRPTETIESYAKFCVYRDLPPDQRSLQKAAAVYYGEKNNKYKAWGKLSKRHEWVARANLYDQRGSERTREIIEPFIDRQREANEHLFALISEEVMEAWRSGDEKKLENVRKKAEALFGTNKLSQLLIDSHKVTIGSKEKIGEGGDDSGIPAMPSGWALIMAKSVAQIPNDKSRVNVQRNGASNGKN